VNATASRQPLLAHQLVHGYKGGHRLLAGSTSLPPDVLRLIDRLSDAAGMRLAQDADGYLSGYPLPGGDYALARTWPAPDAERPNVVWTHTLVLPPAAFSAVSMQPLTTLFLRPRSGTDLGDYTSPLPLKHLRDLPARPVPGGKAAEEVVASLYWGEPGAWLAGGSSPDDLCMAVWSQQWPRLRRSFSFCSGALELRRLDGKDFDLLLAPEGHRAGSPRKSPPRPDPKAARALVIDLREPGKLRDFLRACGPDSGQLRSVPLLTTAWLNARHAEDPADVLAAVADQAPEPTSLRRLKRELLRGPDPLLSRADPVLTLRALTGDIGRRILAEDADLEGWVDRAWTADRQAVLRLAARPSEGDEATAVPTTEPSTAAEAAQDAASDLILDQATSSDLPLLAAEAPELAALSLGQHTEREWWDAWAALPDLGGALTAAATADEGAARSACAALLKRENGTHLWASLHRSNPSSAIRGLLDAVADTGEPLAPKWAMALGPFGKQVVAEVHQGLPWEQMAVVADVAPHAADVGRIPLRFWEPLAEHRKHWRSNPTRTAVLLSAALAAGGPRADELAAEAFTHLHKVFADGRADDAWRVIKPALPGRLDDWDRCRRLEQGVAAVVVGSKRQPPRPGIRTHVPPGRAGDALDATVRWAAADVAKEDRPKNPFDDLFGFLRR
jgi:hypothetical protein